ncbi:hypothetical protein C8Q78DRAFT_552200 [Trametes maxima]|nr:hypothetical protein C8Q78DRAFT_552200 [Trametes maxima]
MPALFRAIAASSKRSLAFVDRATSRILNTLNRVAPTPQHDNVSPIDVESSTNASSSTSDIEEEIDTEIHSENDANSESSQVSSDSDEDAAEETEEDCLSGDERPVYSVGASGTEEYTEIVNSGTTSVLAQPQPDEAEQIAVTATATSSQVQPQRRSYPYRYATAPFAPGSVNIETHLDSSPIRSRSDYLLPHTQAQEAVPEIERPSGCSLNRGQNNTAEFAHATPNGEFSRTYAGCSSSRGRKRSREVERDFDEGGPSSEMVERRPRIRRRLSNPHPQCTRENCLARNLHLLDSDAPSRPLSDDEGAWSHAAQASDSEDDPGSRIAYSQMLDDRRRRRTCRKRTRDQSADSDLTEEDGRSRKRRRGGEP